MKKQKQTKQSRTQNLRADKTEDIQTPCMQHRVWCEGCKDFIDITTTCEVFFEEGRKSERKQNRDIILHELGIWLKAYPKDKSLLDRFAHKILLEFELKTQIIGVQKKT